MNVPDREHFTLTGRESSRMFPIGNTVPVMDDSGNTMIRKASELASAFGSLIRSRRQALSMTQDQLALTTGVGRRFLIDLEAGKISCQIGRGLIVAEALGLRPADILKTEPTHTVAAPELPDLPEEERPDG